MVEIGFIGAGVVGTALAVGLSSRGYPVVVVSSRTTSSAQRLADAVDGCRVCDSGQGVADRAELVFVTTPDDVIAPVVAQLNWHQGQGVIHCSGAYSLDVLEPARQVGAEVGGFHPLQSFASISHAIENLSGSTFAIEGEGLLLDTLKEMAITLDGRWVRLGPGDKVLYHAAAVIACNYFVTLVKLATELWQSFGVSPAEAVEAMLPLLQGTLNNIQKVGLPNCLTGPIARGDLGTIEKHLSALETRAPELLSAYCELGVKTIPVALAKGKIDEERAGELEKILQHSKISFRGEL